MVTGLTGQLQRRARRDDVQAAPRIEYIGQAEQIPLVGAAAVMKHEQPDRTPARRPLAVCEPGHAPVCSRELERGLVIGVSARSSWSRSR